MPRWFPGVGQAAILALTLCGASGAGAQSVWCCDDAAHAGGTAAERCDGNKTTFANVDGCAEHKAKHDSNTGHSSTCSGGVEQTRRGTASGGSRAIGGSNR